VCVGGGGEGGGGGGGKRERGKGCRERERGGRDVHTQRERRVHGLGFRVQGLGCGV
jgi:hypothetical protein